MNRHKTTNEEQAAVLVAARHADQEMTAKALRLILDEPKGSLSKWFSEEAWTEYQNAIRSQAPRIAHLMENDPHSRRIVMYGPPGACWIATQWLSLPQPSSLFELDLQWHVIAYFRSLDIEHTEMDRVLQIVLTDVLKVDRQSIGKLTIIAGSFHEYLGEPHGNE